MNQTSGERIFALRKALDMRQTEFAQLFPVSHITVSRWESGVSEPNPISWRRIEELERQVREKTDI